jgi:hypothetical protein
MPVKFLLILNALLAQTIPTATLPQKQVKNTESVDAEVAGKLLQAKRIFVESFGDDSINKTLQAMVIDAFRTSHRFIVTENKDKADLILKGSALEKTSQELHALGSATAVAGAAGAHSSTISGNARSVSGSSNGGFAAHSVGISDSQASTETISDARMAVRLVSSDGDVVWSTTQESRGAKFKSSSADVADKMIKQLLRDIEKLTNKSVSDLKQ